MRTETFTITNHSGTWEIATGGLTIARIPDNNASLPDHAKVADIIENWYEDPQTLIISEYRVNDQQQLYVEAQVN